MIKIKTVQFDDLNFIFERFYINISVFKNDYVIQEHANFIIYSEDDIFSEIMNSKTIVLQIILPLEEVNFDELLSEGFNDRKIGFIESLIFAIKKKYNPL